jgi:hypothetical protein
VQHSIHHTARSTPPAHHWPMLVLMQPTYPAQNEAAQQRECGVARLLQLTRCCTSSNPCSCCGRPSNLPAPPLTALLLLSTSLTLVLLALLLLLLLVLWTWREWLPTCHLKGGDAAGAVVMVVSGGGARQGSCCSLEADSQASKLPCHKACKASQMSCVSNMFCMQVSRGDHCCTLIEHANMHDAH